MPRRVSVTGIEIDDQGRLLVFPGEVDYSFIYRSATGVHWDQDRRALVGPAPKEWSYLDWYKNIVASVRSEYGDALEATGATSWVNVADVLQADILRQQSGG